MVGNQGCDEDSIEHFKTEKTNVTIYNLTSRGVSKNRNYLLLHATADYVSFFDDDEAFAENSQEVVESFLNNSGCKENIAVRIN